MSQPRPRIDVQGLANGGPVVIGVPFPQGFLSDNREVLVRQPDGMICLVNTRPLSYWPDGTVRWLLLSFITQSSGLHEVELHHADLPESQVAPVACRENEQGILLDNDLVRLQLCQQGEGPVGTLIAHGRQMLKQPRDLRFTVDDADTTRESARTLTVLERGPARCRVRVEGAHYNATGKRRLTYRLDLELWADLPTVRLDYQFFHAEPNEPELSIQHIGLQCDLAMTASATQRHFLQVNHGEFYQPREVRNPAPVGIVVDTQRLEPHVEDPAMLLDEEMYAPYLDPPLVATPPWLGMSDGDVAVYAHVQDFTLTQPKRIHSDGATLGIDIWPRRVGTMTLPQGRSRRTVMTLTFSDVGELSPVEVMNRVTQPLWEGRACVQHDWLAYCGEFEQQFVLPHGKHGRFEHYFRRLMTLETVSDMFDLGDTPEYGYQRNYPKLGPQRQPRLKEAAIMPRVFTHGGALASWVDMTLYEQVWTNNEYDAIHAFACEVMRTGRHDLWPVLRWQVRHNIEVDFWHYRDEKWLHRISPVHSAGHATSGGYPSHFWTQGLLEYYCLTGDEDVREVACALGDAILRFFHDPERAELYRAYDRELGWALLAMTHLWDITREPRFEAEVQRLIQFFIDYHQANPKVPIHSRHYIERFYFMLNMIEAIDLYERRTGLPDLNDWLVGVLAPMRESIRQAQLEGYASHSTAPAMAIAYQRTGDATYLKASLAELDRVIHDDPRWTNPPNTVKPLAIQYREWITLLGQAWKAGLLDQYEYPNLRAD